MLLLALLLFVVAVAAAFCSLCFVWQAVESLNLVQRRGVKNDALTDPFGKRLEEAIGTQQSGVELLIENGLD